MIYHGDPTVAAKFHDGTAVDWWKGDSITDGGDTDGGLERATLRNDPYYYSGGFGTTGANIWAPASLPNPTGCTRTVSTLTVALHASPWTGNSHTGTHSGLSALSYRPWWEIKFNAGTNNISGDSGTGFSQRIYDSVMLSSSAINEAEQLWQGKRFGQNATIKARIIYYAHAGAPQNLRVWRYSTAASSSNTTWSMATSGGITASDWFSFPAWTSYAASSAYPRFTITTGSATRSGADEVAVILGIEWSIDDVGVHRTFFANGGWWPDTYLDNQICSAANFATLANLLGINTFTLMLGVNGLDGGGRTPAITAASIASVIDRCRTAVPDCYIRLINYYPIVGSEAALLTLRTALIALTDTYERCAFCDINDIAGGSTMVAARFLSDGVHPAYTVAPKIGTDWVAQLINQCMQVGAQRATDITEVNTHLDEIDGGVVVLDGAEEGTGMTLQTLQDELDDRNLTTDYIDAAISSRSTFNAASDTVTLADNAITAAKIATDAIDSDAIAASAVTKINAGTSSDAPTLALIKAQTDKITLGQIEVISPFSSGSLTIKAKDTYSSASGQTIQIPEDSTMQWPASFSGYTISFKANKASHNANTGTATILATSVASTGTQPSRTLTVSLTAAQTDVAVGDWTYEIEAVHATDGTNTLISGALLIVANTTGT